MKRLHARIPLFRSRAAARIRFLLNRKRVTAKLRLVRNQLLDDYRFAQPLTPQPVKITLISPDRIQQCYDAEASRTVYSATEAFLKDVVTVERQMIVQLAEAGCQYVGIDGPGYTAYVDGPSIAAMRARGEEPMATMQRSIDADNQVIAGFPGVTFGIHICRGNRQSLWHREGHYDPIAERLFNGLNHQRLLLEYDTERAGGFEPLRFVPKGKIAVLGLITTKVPRLESVDELRRRIDQASRYLPLEQLAISPQCGFASSLRGNLLSEDDQFRKLERHVRNRSQSMGIKCCGPDPAFKGTPAQAAGYRQTLTRAVIAPKLARRSPPGLPMRIFPLAAGKPLHCHGTLRRS